MNKALNKFMKSIKEIESNKKNISMEIKKLEREIQDEEEKNIAALFKGDKIDVKKIITLKEKLKEKQEELKICQNISRENEYVSKLANDVIREYWEEVRPVYVKMYNDQPKELEELEAQYLSEKNKLERKHRKDRKKLIEKHIAARHIALDYANENIPKAQKVHLQNVIDDRYY